MKNPLKEINYPTFVAISNQVNTPPGSHETIKSWIANSFINKDSKVLEIGCSTGFITYQIYKYTGAETFGVDLSPESIEKARKNCKNNPKIHFTVENAQNLSFPDQTFTHVIIGGHLPWVSEENHKKHIQEALRVLKSGGFLLSALYYYSSKPRRQLIEKFNTHFNTQLKSFYNYAYWNNIFNFPNLDLEYESNFDIILPSKKRVKDYLSKFEGDYLKIWQKKVKLFQENGKHLSFFIKVFVKDEIPIYKQFPRGGIYRWKKKQ
jgi:ubiquinone/menaquinone biosynthesis C-methylase UbiE